MSCWRTRPGLGVARGFRVPYTQNTPLGGNFQGRFSLKNKGVTHRTKPGASGRPRRCISVEKHRLAFALSPVSRRPAGKPVRAGVLAYHPGWYGYHTLEACLPCMPQPQDSAAGNLMGAYIVHSSGVLHCFSWPAPAAHHRSHVSSVTLQTLVIRFALRVACVRSPSPG